MENKRSGFLSEMQNLWYFYSLGMKEVKVCFFEGECGLSDKFVLDHGNVTCMMVVILICNQIILHMYEGYFNWTFI